MHTIALPMHTIQGNGKEMHTIQCIMQEFKINLETNQGINTHKIHTLWNSYIHQHQM
jgi:hypothetical protein